MKIIYNAFLPSFIFKFGCILCYYHQMDIAYSVQLYIFVNGRRLVENETTAVAMLFVERHLNATFYAEHPTLGLVFEKSISYGWYLSCLPRVTQDRV